MSLALPVYYADFVACIAVILSIPFVILAAVLTMIPLFIWAIISSCGSCSDCIAYPIWWLNHYLIAYPIHFVNKYFIYLISFNLYPWGFFLYFNNNQRVINLIRDNCKTVNPDYSGE